MPPVPIGRSSSRIDREATAEAGFVRTPLVLRLALKALFTMPLRRSHNALRISSVGLICAFFSLGSMASPLTCGFDFAPFSPPDRSSLDWERAPHSGLVQTDHLNLP
jgi:hypothetical protein